MAFPFFTFANLLVLYLSTYSYINSPPIYKSKNSSSYLTIISILTYSDFNRLLLSNIAVTLYPFVTCHQSDHSNYIKF